jgi:hypothetical protein
MRASRQVRESMYVYRVFCGIRPDWTGQAPCAVYDDHAYSLCWGISVFVLKLKLAVALAPLVSSWLAVPRIGSAAELRLLESGFPDKV